MKELNFTLTDKEISELEKFYNDHQDCPFASALGGKYTFIITPIGIGQCTIVKCNSCNEKLDITDFESW
jgi:hypothetical protein